MPVSIERGSGVMGAREAADPSHGLGPGSGRSVPMNALGLAAEDVGGPHVLVIRAFRRPVMEADRFIQRPAGVVPAVLFVQRHCKDEARACAQRLGGVAGHDRNSVVESPLAIAPAPQ